MAEKLTKAELVEELYESQGLTRKDIHECVDDLFEELKRAMLAGKAVELRGFGTFEVRQRKGRARARNPKTGETVSVECFMSSKIPGIRQLGFPEKSTGNSRISAPGFSPIITRMVAMASSQPLPSIFPNALLFWPLGKSHQKSVKIAFFSSL